MSTYLKFVEWMFWTGHMTVNAETWEVYTQLTGHVLTKYNRTQAMGLVHRAMQEL